MVLEQLISAGISIFSSTLGSLAGNVYDGLTNKLKDGDSVDQKLREMFVRDANNIKTMLADLSLSELGASRSFLEEGLEYLKLAVDESSEVDTETTKGRLASAKRCFLQSHKAATKACYNRSLSIKKNIAAFMIRILARILESYNDPRAATVTCLVALKELHDIRPVQNDFSLFLDGGTKANLQKAERLEIVMFVLLINHALFQFASKESKNGPNLSTWPEMKLTNSRTFNLIKNAHIILAKVSRNYELVKQMNENCHVWRIFTSQRPYAVNSRDEIILLTNDKITVINSTGESRDVMFDDPAETNVLDAQRCSLAVDRNDNVYAIRWLKKRDENGGEIEDLVLYTFDENCENKREFVFDFLYGREYKNVNIGVAENQNLIMITNNDNQVHVCDNTGKTKFTFKQDESWILMNMSIFDNNKFLTVSDDRRGFKIYSSEGTLENRKEYPEGHKVMQAASHRGTRKITVLTLVERDERNFWYRLYSYSEKGEMEGSKVLPQLNDLEKYWWGENIDSLPSTAVAVVVGKNIAFF